MTVKYALEKRSADILKTILYTEGFVKVRTLTSQLGISRRSAYYDLEKIDDWLRDHGLKDLVRDRNRGVSIDKEQKDLIRQLLSDDKGSAMRVFTPMERERVIICLIILAPHPLYTEDFMELCMVSRNTAVSDLKNVAAFLKKNGMKLRYLPRQGHRIQGDIVRIRALMCLYYPQFSEFFRETVFYPGQLKIIDDYHLRFKKIEHELQAEYVSGILPALAVLTASIVQQASENGNTAVLRLSTADKETILSTKEYRLVCALYPELPEAEQVYLTLHLLGSRLQVKPLVLEESRGQADEIAQKLADSFEEITGIPCGDNQELLSALSAHLSTSLYRYRYGIQLGNPMLDRIRTQYKELFELTKAAFLRISDETGLHVSDAEIAYLALHFGGLAGSAHPADETFRILIVCPNGVGASNMIKAEVRRLVPQTAQIDNTSLNGYRQNNDYDLILSTVPIPGEKRVIEVSPILTDLDKIAILRKCVRTGPSAKIQLDDILAIAEKYIPSDARQAFAQELGEYFDHVGESQVPGAFYGSGILHYLQPSHIRFVGEQVSWEEAVEEAFRPLLLNDSITQNYVDAVLAAQRAGVYMFLSDGLVLLHSQPENGVKKVDVSMVVCQKPVLFGNGRLGWIIIGLAAEDQTRHIQVLNDILAVFSDKKAIEKITSMADAAEVTGFIQEKLQ